MKNIQSKIIANEFEVSPTLINYKVENHNNIRSYSSISPVVLNKAELVAIKEEQFRLEEEMIKKQLIEERNKKIKENIKIYKNIQKEKEELNKKQEYEKTTKKEKIKEYNNQLREKAISKKNKLDKEGSTPNNISFNNMNDEMKNSHMNIPNRDFCTFSCNEIVDKEEIEKVPTPMGKNSIYEKLNPCLGTSVVNLRNDIDKLIKQKLDGINANNSLNQRENLKANIYNEPIKNINITAELDRNIDAVKDFRKTGLLSHNSNKNIIQNNNSINNNHSNVHISQSVANKDETNTSVKNKKNLPPKEKNKQYTSELEKRRYMKALKNLMIEKFSEKKIIIPNICSCGQLQKKLDSLLEDKNISIYSVLNMECANNCIYYNNTQEYHKALSDIIHSVKNLKFESFNTQSGKY